MLLKNEGGLLPLDRDAVKSIAVFGPRANSVMLGLYSGEPPYRVSRRSTGSGRAAGNDVKVITPVGFFGDPVAIAKAADVADRLRGQRSDLQPARA